MTLVHITATDVVKDDVAIGDNGLPRWRAVEDAVVADGFARFAIARSDPGPLTILTITATAALLVERKPRPFR